MPRRTSHHARSQNKKASTLVVTVIFTATLSAVAAVLLSYQDTERRVSAKRRSGLEATAGVELLADYALGQIAPFVRALPPSNFKPDPQFAPGGAHAIVAPAGDLARTGSPAKALLDPSVSEVTASKLVWINSGDASTNGKFMIPVAGNEADIMRGQRIYRSLLGILVKTNATVPGKSGESTLRHAVVFVDKRDAPTFNYALFNSGSNLIFPALGSDLTVAGPVFSNHRVVFQTKGNSSGASPLWLKNGFFTAADVKDDYAALRLGGVYQFTSASRVAMGQATDIDKAFNMVDAKITGFEPDGTPKYGPRFLWDSAADGFVDKMSVGANKAVQTAANGIQSVQPRGLVSDITAATIVKDPVTGEKYDLSTERPIDPIRPAVMSSSSASKEAKEVENVKISAKASIYVVVENNGTVTAFNNPDQAIQYKQSGNRDAWRAGNAGQILDLSGVILPAQPGEAKVPVGLPHEGEAWTPRPTRTLFDPHLGQTVTLVDVNVGALKTKLASGISYANGSAWNTTDTTSNSGTYVAKESRKGWNGIVYVDVEAPRQKFSTINSVTMGITPAEVGDTTRPALPTTPSGATADFGRTAVRLVNAKDVPGAAPGVSEPGTSGFTFATNAPVYIKGSFNADGDRETGKDGLQDDQPNSAAGTSTVPASIWADKVLVQSEGFGDTDLLDGLYIPKPASKPDGITDADYANWPFRETGTAGLNSGYSGSYTFSYPNRVDSAVIEINSAVVTDNAAGVGSQVSFMEKFNGSLVRVRGSLVSIWRAKAYAANNKEAETAADNTYYRFEKNPDSAGGVNQKFWNPAAREIAFSSVFAAGRMPPGAGTITDLRKVRRFFITEAAYAALKEESDPLAWVTYLNAHPEAVRN